MKELQIWNHGNCIKNIPVVNKITARVEKKAFLEKVLKFPSNSIKDYTFYYYERVNI